MWCNMLNHFPELKKELDKIFNTSGKSIFEEFSKLEDYIKTRVHNILVPLNINYDSTRYTHTVKMIIDSLKNEPTKLIQFVEQPFDQYNKVLREHYDAAVKAANTSVSNVTDTVQSAVQQVQDVVSTESKVVEQKAEAVKEVIETPTAEVQEAPAPEPTKEEISQVVVPPVEAVVETSTTDSSNSKPAYTKKK